jgi:hypothetical protein
MVEAWQRAQEVSKQVRVLWHFHREWDRRRRRRRTKKLLLLQA